MASASFSAQSSIIVNLGQLYARGHVRLYASSELRRPVFLIPDGFHIDRQHEIEEREPLRPDNCMDKRAQ
jgi:hypothetical protein